MSPPRALARIDLAAIRHNAALLARTAAPARLTAVVKADAYGHGAVPVARAALDGGARGLAVATVVEAEELRGAGVDAPLILLGPLADGEFARALDARCEIVCWTPEAVTAVGDLSGPSRPARVHLELDTGMGRLGARPDDVAALADAAAAQRGVVVAGLMTHFATADEREGDGSTFFREQVVRFRAALAGLRARFPEAAAHAANSAATLREPASRLDMVRCGIALYGCSPFGADPGEFGLVPAMEWTSRIGQLKRLRSRDSAGYGRTWRAARGTWLAVVPVGYADGFSRSLSNRAHVIVGGRLAPVVGTVSMDLIAVDLGPEAEDRVGDEVVLLGRRGGLAVSAEDAAAWRGTITYEVTCNVGRRVPREHVG